MVKNMKVGNDWKKTIWKVVQSALVFGLPIFITWLADFHPEIAGLTIGALLTGFLNWLKHRK